MWFIPLAYGELPYEGKVPKNYSLAWHFLVIRKQPLEWWANKLGLCTWHLLRRCYLWFHSRGGFMCYGAPGLLGLGVRQLNCCGWCDRGRSAVLLCSGGGLDETPPLIASGARPAALF